MSSETKVDDCYYSTNNEGFYNGYNDVYQVKFDGETLWKVHAKLKFGEFGEAPEKIVEETGCKNFNVKFDYGWDDDDEGVNFGVITSKGLVLWDRIFTRVVHFSRTNDEEAKDEALNEEEKDPIDAPPGSYELQPENQEKEIMDCFVFYECDCFYALRNPYIPLDVENPTNYQVNQRKLTGKGIEEREEILKNRDMYWWNSESVELGENMKNLFTALCDDIKSERKRIGGHWVVTDAKLIKKSVRDFIRSMFGDELVIVDISMSKDEIRERLSKRHGVEAIVEDIMALAKSYDPVEEDEENVLSVEIDSSMNKADVTNKVKKACKKHFSKKEFDNSYIESHLFKETRRRKHRTKH